LKIDPEAMANCNIRVKVVITLRFVVTLSVGTSEAWVAAYISEAVKGRVWFQRAGYSISLCFLVIRCSSLPTIYYYGGFCVFSKIWLSRGFFL